MKKVLLEIGVALFFGALCITSCSDDDKDESNPQNSENTSGMGSSGTSGSSGSQGSSVTSNLSKGDAQMVDLGLPSGTKWADRNIGATSPEDYGAYFAWGETSSKSDYSWSTYLDSNIAFGYDCGTDKDVIWRKFGSKADIAGTSYDAATVNWGAGYKMPTDTQWSELLGNSGYTTWTWCDGVDTKYNNTTVVGYKVTSKTNGNSIFIPAAGYRYGTNTYYAGSIGYYWSSSLSWSFPHEAWNMGFGVPSGRAVYGHSRLYGLSVRPVME